MTRFGFWAALTSACVPLLVVSSPWIAWLRYTRRRPSTRRGLLAWSIVAGVIVVMLLASPVWLWAGPVLAVVLSETVRTLTEPDQPEPEAAFGAGRRARRAVDPMTSPLHAGTHHFGFRARRAVVTARPAGSARVGQPPPLRGSTPTALARFAIACRVSALVLERQGHSRHAEHLRRLGDAADRQAQHRQSQEPAHRGIAA